MTKMPLHSTATLGIRNLAAGCLVLLGTSVIMAQENAVPAADRLSFGIPPGPLIGMASALLLLLLLLWGIKQPLAWIIVSFITIGGGISCAGYGAIMYCLADKPLRRGDVEELAIFFVAGLGSTVAGVVLLVVALIRHRKSARSNA
jgi:hypothetical protein